MSGPNENAQPARVLIADDEPGVLELLQEFLADEGYEVATAATGTEVLDLVAGFRPDVVVLDMAMPGMSGAEVLAALRGRGVQAPVIVISGATGAAGPRFFEILTKPFHFPAIARAVAAAVEQGRGRG
ncbi:MAG: response regulator transcription factor [Candidatus Rokuibacteriota bacterium]